MADITLVLDSDTPNEGRVVWNENFTNLNDDVVDLQDRLADATGNIVGTDSDQELKYKTVISLNSGGTNTFLINRHDFDDDLPTFIIKTRTTAAGGGEGEANVYLSRDDDSQDVYLHAENGLYAEVSDNEIYLKCAEECYLNEDSQIFGVGVSDMGGNYMGRIGGSLKLDGKLGISSGTLTDADTSIHIKSTGYDGIKIDSTTFESLWLRNSAHSATQYTELTYDNSTNLLHLIIDTEPIISGSSSHIYLNKPTDVNGDVNIDGDINVSGILTVSSIENLEDMIVIDSTEILISGHAAVLNSGTVSLSKLVSLPSGLMIIGSDGNRPTAAVVSGHVYTSYVDTKAILTLYDNSVQASKLYPLTSGHILIGQGLGNAVLSRAVSGDITINTAGITAISTGVIINDDIHSSANIAISKTALTTGSGITLSGNTISVKRDDLVSMGLNVPIGTIIPYAGGFTEALNNLINSTNTSPLIDFLTVESGVYSWLYGFLYCNGAQLSGDSKYTSLKTVLSSNWGGTNLLPDLRGMFLRGFTDNILRDPDTDYRKKAFGNSSSYAGVGSYQADQIIAHTHQYEHVVDEQGNTAQDGVGVYHALINNMNNSYYTLENGDKAETTVKNMYVHYLIKY